MRSKWVRRVAIVLLAFLIVGTLWADFGAVGLGMIWGGENYWHQPIPLILRIVVFSFIGVFGVYWLARYWRWWI